MSLQEIQIPGTLRPDGTLELDQKPNLPAGRVTVVLRQESEPALAKEGWWNYMQRVRADRETTGYHFMNEEEMEARLRGLRDDDERIDSIYQEMDEEQRRRESP